MDQAEDRGGRLLPAKLDHVASQEPDRAWISVPKEDDDLGKGFVGISYKQFANAVNHASNWLEFTLGPSGGQFDSFSYEGPNDARLPIIAVAAAKVVRKVQNIIDSAGVS